MAAVVEVGHAIDKILLPKLAQNNYVDNVVSLGSGYFFGASRRLTGLRAHNFSYDYQYVCACHSLHVDYTPKSDSLIPSSFLNADIFLVMSSADPSGTN